MASEIQFPSEVKEVDELQHGVLSTYAPPTIEDALAMNIPEMVLADHEDRIALARDLSSQMVPGMTEFQIKEFVAGDVADRVTPYGVYQQALRELGSRYTAILQARHEYEKNQARLKTLRVSKQRLEYKLTKADDLPPKFCKSSLEAALARVEVEINNILRQLPLAEVNLRDTVRQLVHYIDVWQETKEKVDLSIPNYEMERIEWEARVILRYFKGKFGYIPVQFDNGFLNEALEFAMDMREYGLTNQQAAEVASRENMSERREALSQLIQRESLSREPVILPISNQDELPNLIHQRQQMEAYQNQTRGK